jgi:hypothetical protein
VVVDQMLRLLVPERSGNAELDVVDLLTGRTDTSLPITLRHESGAQSHISASKLNHPAEPARVCSKGSCWRSGAAC